MTCECDALMERIEELEWQVSELLGGGKVPPKGFDVNGAVFRIANLMARRSPGMVSLEALLMASAPDVHSQPMLKTVAVRICQLRRLIRPYGLDIETIHGRGYRMPSESAAHWIECVEAGEMRPLLKVAA